MTHQVLEYYNIRPEHMPDGLAFWGLYVRSGTWPVDMVRENWDLKTGRFQNDIRRDARLFEAIERQGFCERRLTHREAALASSLYAK